jgi:hypothetical protein
MITEIDVLSSLSQRRIRVRRQAGVPDLGGRGRPDRGGRAPVTELAFIEPVGRKV